MFKEFKSNYIIINEILYSKYGNIELEIEKKSINILINKRKSHYLAKYNDYLIYDYMKDFFRKKYQLKDSLDKLSKLAKYYKSYLSFFCRPFCTNFYYNRLLDNYFDNKAENFYKETFGKTSKDFKKKKSIINNIIIFDEKAKKTIENPTQSTLNLNTLNSELNTQRLLEEDFLTSKTLKEGISDIINTMDKKKVKKQNKTIEKIDSTQRTNSRLGLFTIYKKNKVNSERKKFFIGIRDNSPPNNEEKSSLNQFKKLKPYKNNQNISTQKNSFNSNPLSYMKNHSLKNSLKISYNKNNINISNIILESKKKGIVYTKKSNLKSFSSIDKKHITINSNMLSTYINNCLNLYKNKSITKNNSVNSYKNNSFKHSTEKNSNGNIRSTRIKEDNKKFQPLSINYISNVPKKSNISLKKKSGFTHSLENLTKNVKSFQGNDFNNNNKKKKNLNLKVHTNINNINIDIHNGNNTSNNSFQVRNKSVTNFFKKSRNKSNEKKGKVLNNELDKIIEKIKCNIHINKKLKFNSPNHLDNAINSIKKLKNTNNHYNNNTSKHKRINSKKGDNIIFSCRNDSTKKKKLCFGPINN